MAEDRTSLHSRVLVDSISGPGNEQKEQDRVFVVPRASGQMDFIGPGGASLNTNIISMTIIVSGAISSNTALQYNGTDGTHNETIPGA